MGAAVLITSLAPAHPGQGAPAAAPPGHLGRVLDVADQRAAAAAARQAVVRQLRAAQERDASAARGSKRKRTTETAAPKPTKSAVPKPVKAEKPAASKPSPTAPRAAAAARPSSSPAAPVHAVGAAAVVAFVKAQLGKPYALGGVGPTVFDCSGLVQAAYLTIGVALPRVSEAQSTAGTQVSLNSLQPGDILYWGSAGSAYHVAIYVGGGDFIGAQNPSDGVIEHSIDFDEPSGAVRAI